MLCLQSRLIRTAVPSQSGVVPQMTKRYARKRVTSTEIQEALEKKRQQKKTALEKFVHKYGGATHIAQEGERDALTEEAKALRESRLRASGGFARPERIRSEKKEKDPDAAPEAASAGGAEGTRPKSRKSKKDPKRGQANVVKASSTEVSLGQWHDDFKEAHWERPEVMEALSDQLSVSAYNKILHLYYRDPNYWTPVRLASLVRCPVDYMRGLLWEAKLIREAGEHGITFDNDIEYLMGENFGTVDISEGFEDDAHFEVPVRKIHNPWYFVDPALKSGELLKFVRSKETRHYREASRIPAQRLPKAQVFDEVLPPDVKQRKFPTGKKGKYFIVDNSSCYNLYTRPIVVRDTDNTWRTPTWEERRWIFHWRKPVKPRPFRLPFVYPDNNQPDRQATQNKAPHGFDVRFPYETDDFLASQAPKERPEGEEEAGQEGAGSGHFSLKGKWNLNPKKTEEEDFDVFETDEERSDFNSKYRVAFDYGKNWKEPATY